MADDPYAAIAQPVTDPYEGIAKTPPPPPSEHGALYRGAAALGSDIGNMFSKMPSGVSPYPGMDIAAKQNILQSGIDQNQQRIAEGHAMPYRAAAALAQAGGVNVPGIEQSVKQGDYASAAGHALAVPATIAATYGISRGIDALPESATPSSVAGAPVRLAARAAEIAVNKGLKPAVKLFTPADEALANPWKAPGRDLGLGPKSPLEWPKVDVSGRTPLWLQQQADEAAQASAPQAQGMPATPEELRAAIAQKRAGMQAPQTQGPLTSIKLQPDVPLRDQLPAMQNRGTSSVPAGHVPTPGSTAMQSYKVDPQLGEIEVLAKEGSHHIYGDVSPEQSRDFLQNDSKGDAWNKLRNSPGVVRVGKVVNGKRIAVNNLDPTSAAPEGEDAIEAARRDAPDDLTPQFQQAYSDVLQKKIMDPAQTFASRQQALKEFSALKTQGQSLPDRSSTTQRHSGNKGN